MSYLDDDRSEVFDHDSGCTCRQCDREYVEDADDGDYPYDDYPEEWLR